MRPEGNVTDRLSLGRRLTMRRRRAELVERFGMPRDEDEEAAGNAYIASGKPQLLEWLAEHRVHPDEPGIVGLTRKIVGEAKSRDDVRHGYL
jgi:hypothetical protein